ncbi:protein THEM6-like [Xenopus laevis]|uniref:Protein THEM6 n=1 Tax=Xenopus laevis TaxID=8355 RepID=A0A8J0U7S9_XENLA|nr:protein THEM6-like [Xenopus laevis]
MLFLVIVSGVISLMVSLLDVWYFIRGTLVVLKSRIQPVVKDLLKEHSYLGKVLPHDLDFLLHMNNSRYLREADFARFALYTHSGLFQAMHSLGCSMVR